MLVELGSNDPAMITDAWGAVWRVLSLVSRLGLNLGSVAVLVWVIYLPRRRSRDFAFSYVMLNLVTFALCWLMNAVPMDLGLGLGLFAIFGILRYRTQALQIRDLTYLFVAIGLAVINGIEHPSIHIGMVVLLDAVTLVLLAALELRDSSKGQRSLTLLYDRLDLLGDDSRDALLADLTERLNMRCTRVDIGTVDMLRETVELTVFADRAKP